VRDRGEAAGQPEGLLGVGAPSLPVPRLSQDAGADFLDRAVLLAMLVSDGVFDVGSEELGRFD